jgi:transposase-like protein
MPWKDKTVEDTREELIKRTLAKEKSKSALCREYGISRPTGDKWISRYENGEVMKDRSRAPFKNPNKTDKETEQMILDLRKMHPAQRATKLKRVLENKGEKNLPCNSNYIKPPKIVVNIWT